MDIFRVAVICWLSAVSTAATLEVRGRVGEDATFRCPAGPSARDVLFCRGACTSGSILIQAAEQTPAVTQQGRYGVEVFGADGVFTVTIRTLRRVDAGSYQCWAKTPVRDFFQEVRLSVLDGLPESTEAPAAAATSPTRGEKTNKRAAGHLSDTTVVIIVSVSLALLVCAIIPLIFYGHWQSSAESQNRDEANKGDAEYGGENLAVRLESVESERDTESETQDAAYKALDPHNLD